MRTMRRWLLCIFSLIVLTLLAGCTSKSDNSSTVASVLISDVSSTDTEIGKDPTSPFNIINIKDGYNPTSDSTSTSTTSTDGTIVTGGSGTSTESSKTTTTETSIETGGTLPASETTEITILSESGPTYDPLAFFSPSELDPGIEIEPEGSTNPDADPFANSGSWSENPLVQVLFPIPPTNYPEYDDFMLWIHTIRDNNRAAVIDVLTCAANLETKTGAYNSIAGLRDILGYVINQDSLDNDAYNAYWTDFYGYLNRINAANTGMKDDIYDISFKVMNGFLDTGVYTGNMELALNDFRILLADTSSPAVKDLIYDFEDGLGKLLLQSNDYITYSTKNTYLGNSVAGTDLVLQAVSNIALNDADAKANLYNIIREIGKLLNSTEDADNFTTIFKRFLMQVEDYYTQGGALVTSNYVNTGSSPYINSELRNTVQELWPNLAKLFIRDDEGTHGAGIDDFSIIENSNGYSPLEDLTVKLDRLKSIGIDYSDPSYIIEDSLEKMLELDKSGRARGTESNLSILDHLLYTVAIGYNFGYLTWKNGSGTDWNAEPEYNFNRRHGKSTKGIMTNNDAIYSIQTRENLGMNTYNSVMDDRTGQGAHVHRSSSSFTSAQRSSHNFYIGYDYPPLLYMPTACAGDAGIPNGGETCVTVNSNDTDQSMSGGTNDFRTYWPKVYDGKGMLNAASFVMGWIARVCWKGQGPYYSTQGVTVVGNVYTYYRPDGGIYARVTKPNTSDPTTWTYAYPVNANDVADDTGQRANRYRDTWKSDYYLGHFSSSYVAPPVNPNGWANNLVDGTGYPNKYHLNASSGIQPSYFQYYEKIKEKGTVAGDATKSIRECATNEEAMYRNFQWLLLEKKFVCIVPMYVDITYIVNLKSSAYAVVEANGILGLAKGRKTSNNGYWISQTNTGVGEGTISTPNVPDYKDSYELGDCRMQLFNYVTGICGIDLTPEVLWNGTYILLIGNITPTLGDGYFCPEILGKNIDPFLQLGFLGYNTAASKRWCMIGSGDRTTGGSHPWTSAYSNRNKLLPLLIGLVATLHDGTKYVPAGSGYNYNYAGAHKYPMSDLLEGIAIPMTKPFMRLFYNAATPGYRWFPQVKTVSADYNFFTSQGADNNYLPNDSLRTLTSLMTGNTTSNHNGALPLVCNTKILANVLSLLTRLGSTARATDRQKVFQGVEQIMTSFQTTKGWGLDTTRTWLNYTNYAWMFKPLRATPVPLDLDTALDDLVGSNTLNKGIAKFVDNRLALYPSWDTADDNYAKAINALKVILGNTSSPYYITEDVISTIDSFLGNPAVAPTQADLRSLRHTLGILMTRYGGGTWTTDTVIRDLLTVSLPDALTVFPVDADPPNHGRNLLIVARALFDWNNNGVVEPDLMDFGAEVMDLGNTPQEVIINLHNLLLQEEMWNSAYISPNHPREAVLHTLADVLRQLVTEI